MRRRLIVTADDFGRAVPVNEAVEQAHRRGILTAASLMVTGGAAADAVTRARALPSLAVGLHLVLVDGVPALPPARIPDLVEADGRFGRRLVALGARLYLDPGVRRQAEAEIRAQFELFRATGLALDHVDSHHHYHLHPTVFALLLPLAREYGAAGVRIPHEPPFAAWRAAGRAMGRRLAHAAFHFRRTRRMRRQVEEAGMVANRAVFGIADSGGMDRERLLATLDQLPDGLSEVYAHPATRGWQPDPFPAAYRAVEEYQALADPTVAEWACRLDIRLTTFGREAALRRASAA